MAINSLATLQEYQYFIQSGNDIYFDTGNVGINNTNPTYTLDITGNINFTGNIYQNGALYTIGSSLNSNEPLDTAIQAAVFMIGV